MKISFEISFGKSRSKTDELADLLLRMILGAAGGVSAISKVMLDSELRKLNQEQ